MDSMSQVDHRTVEGVEWFLKDVHIKLVEGLRSAVRQRQRNGGDHPPASAAAQDSERRDATGRAQEVRS